MVKNWKNLGQATLSATFLSGALLVTVPANAQDAAIPVQIATAPVAQNQATIDLEFENIQVVELLKVIAKTCKIGVIINEDVNGVLSYVNISSKTPEEALQYVARNAGLKVRREADGTYQISKSSLEIPQTVEAGTTNSIAPVRQNLSGDGFSRSTIERANANAFDLPTLAPTQSNYALGRSSSDIDGLPELVETKSASSQRASKGSTPIKIKNMKASVMAYWLDPANNPVPVDFLVGRDAEKNYTDKRIAKMALGPDDQASLNGSLANQAANNANYDGVVPSPYLNPYVRNSSSSRIAPEVRSNFQFGGFGGNNNGNNNRGNNNRNGNGNNNRNGGGGNNGGGSFELPGEIERIVAIDPQNVILVAGGTQADIEALQKIIDVLDKPLRQVEIEAQFVTVSTSDSRQFGIDYSTSRGNFDFNTNGFAPGNGPGTIQVGFVRGNFQAQLTALKSQNRAKVLTAPRVTAINNLTAMIQSQQSRPVILNTIGNSGGVLGGGTNIQADNLVYITTSIGLQVTPTINGDDTITVLMQPQLQSQTPLDSANGAPIIDSNMVQTIANVRDGDTIALGGLKNKSITRGGTSIPLLSDIPIIGKLFRNKLDSDNESELIIFVTARIVRRAGDDEDVVPGT